MATRVHDGDTSAVFLTGGNWVGGTAPANGDTAIFNFTSVTNGVDGADLTGTITSQLALLQLDATYELAFGSNGTPIKVGATVAEFHKPSGYITSGLGSGRINWDMHTVQSTVYIYGSASSATDSDKEPIRIKGGHTSTVVNIMGGKVGFGTDTVGDVATIDTIRVTENGYATIAAASVLESLIISDNGTVHCSCNVTTGITMSGGTLNTYGDYTLAAVTVKDASVTFNHRASSGNDITTLTLDGADIDISNSPEAFAVATIIVNGPSTIRINRALPSHFTYTTLTLNADLSIVLG